MKAVNLFRNERGSLLVGSVIILFFMVTLGLSFLKIGQYEADLAHDRLRDLKAFWKGEEGLMLAAALLKDSANVEGVETQTALSPDSFYAMVSVERSPLSPSKYLARSLVFKSGRGQDTLLALSSLLVPKTAGDYFFLEDHAGEAYYDAGDTIRGPVHSNKGIKATREAVFMSDVLSCGCSEEEGFEENPLVPQGEPKIVSDNPPVWNAPEYDFSKMADQIKSQGLEIPVSPGQEAVVELKGKTLWLSYRSKSDPSVVTAPIPQILESTAGLFFDGDVEIHGVLNGRLTLGASGDITISGDIVYQPNTNSMLGLISENNVKVDQEQQSHEVGKGITIQASVVAIRGSFEVVNYRRYGNKSMGTMHFLGSIAQYERGTIGSVKLKADLHKGYYKDWMYDERLKNDPPPYFPPLSVKGSSQITFKTVAWSRTL